MSFAEREFWQFVSIGAMFLMLLIVLLISTLWPWLRARKSENHTAGLRYVKETVHPDWPEGKPKEIRFVKPSIDGAENFSNQCKDLKKKVCKRLTTGLAETADFRDGNQEPIIHPDNIKAFAKSGLSLDEALENIRRFTDASGKAGKRSSADISAEITKSNIRAEIYSMVSQIKDKAVLDDVYMFVALKAAKRFDFKISMNEGSAVGATISCGTADELEALERQDPTQKTDDESNYDSTKAPRDTQG